MLKYHVAVCDDEKSDLDGIVQSVQQYDVQGCFDIETYMDGNELLSELQMQKKSCSSSGSNMKRKNPLMAKPAKNRMMKIADFTGVLKLITPVKP